MADGDSFSRMSVTHYRKVDTPELCDSVARMRAPTRENSRPYSRELEGHNHPFRIHRHPKCYDDRSTSSHRQRWAAHSGASLICIARFIRSRPEPIRHALHGVQRPKPSPMGFNTPCTLSTRNPSAEWGVAPSHHLAPSGV
ncbi:hypothetical protein CRG98_028517 [Punica granatum]|uniref:Uncharacterized protein n=1 Tax=Punica granatum TaxID=22663 RepID=A0A2I0J4D9_PUNGR|nr:hypothetical protein CRG98_028517 [Punica granatum]